MIDFTTGNLLEANVEALVNTVNTVGVMGKGIALMFKEAFPDNFKAYAEACKKKEVRVGEIFVTERAHLHGPKWIINFPTKSHWRNPSKVEWIRAGLLDLRNFIRDRDIRSIALPPLGSGNGGLDWSEVKPLIIEALSSLPDVHVMVYEPTQQYQNVSKRVGVQKLTPARALVAEMIRRYWILGFECTLLEVQKLSYFSERCAKAMGLNNALNFQFAANKFGPYTRRITHLLDNMDGSYLHCDKRLSDAGPFDVIWFDDNKKDVVHAYLRSEGKAYLPTVHATSYIIEGFESPLGMEALATIDWLIHHEGIKPSLESVKMGLKSWPGGRASAERKIAIFDDDLIGLVVERLCSQPLLVS